MSAVSARGRGEAEEAGCAAESYEQHLRPRASATQRHQRRTYAVSRRIAAEGRRHTG